MNKATLNALAFNEPNKLSAERETALSAARATKKDPAADAAWRERAERLVTAIEKGGVLDA